MATLFLDEIGDLTLLMARQTASVYKTTEVESAGGIGSTPLNIRLITANTSPLEA